MNLLRSEATHVDYIATFLPIATFAVSAAIGLVGGFFVWRQWRVARNKLRLDLFDRRWKIYEATSKFVDCRAAKAKRGFVFRRRVENRR